MGLWLALRLYDWTCFLVVSCVCLSGVEKIALRFFPAGRHLPGPSQVIRDTLIIWGVEKEGMDLDLLTAKDELTHSYHRA